MTSLISSLTGQFGRAILLNVLLPVTVFVLLVLALVWLEIPPDVPFVHGVDALNPERKLAAITLAVVLLTMLLYTLNGLIIRFYEGYPWCNSWLGRWRRGGGRASCASAWSPRSSSGRACGRCSVSRKPRISPAIRIPNGSELEPARAVADRAKPPPPPPPP
jgi:hypothetical protein